MLRSTPRRSSLRALAPALSVLLLAGALLVATAGCTPAPREDTAEKAPTPEELRRRQRQAEYEAWQRQRAERLAAAEARREAEREAAPPPPVVYDAEKNRELQQWGERSRREQERRERELFGKVLTPEEREEVSIHGKLLTEEERAAWQEEQARLAAEQEAAEAEAARRAAEEQAAAEAAASDSAAAEQQARVERLRSLGGEQYVRYRNELLREGAIDAGTDYRDERWTAGTETDTSVD